MRAETSCTTKNRDFLYPHEKCLGVPTINPPLSLNFTKNLRSKLYSVRTSRETDLEKLKITLVTMTYHSQHPQCPSLSRHVLLLVPVVQIEAEFCNVRVNSNREHPPRANPGHLFHDESRGPGI